MNMGNIENITISTRFTKCVNVSKYMHICYNVMTTERLIHIRARTSFTHVAKSLDTRFSS